jgi:hypothetical protein
VVPERPALFPPSEAKQNLAGELGLFRLHPPHLLPGSVAAQVLRAAPVPVLLFPARALQAIPAEAQAGPAA